jgi:hypothetical protein
MKVLDLACSHCHSFEGWFGSEDDFQSQLMRGLVQCPICDDAKITKKLSAPRLNLSGARKATSVDAEIDSNAKQDAPNSVALRADSLPTIGQNDAQNTVKNADHEHPLHTLMQNPEFQVAYMQMAKEVLAKTEDVGKDFAREARKIHYGESKGRGKRGIRGQVSHDETMELLDEGIDVMPLPLPKALKGPLQ